MDIDTLFTVIFVVFIILFQLFGTAVSRLAKRDQAAEQDKPAKAAGLLNTLKNRVSREIQIAMQQAAAVQKEPDGRTEAVESLWQTRQAKPTSPDIYHEAGVSAAEITAIEEEGLIDEIRHELLDESIENTAVTRPVETRPVSDPVRYTQADLQRAVIWSEILAPPLALRD